MAKDSSKSKKTKPPETAMEYNTKKSGVLWTWADLPSHMSDCKKRPALLVAAVRVFQKQQGLVSDGMLGPKTLKQIRSVWSLAPLSGSKEDATPEVASDEPAEDD